MLKLSKVDSLIFHLSWPAILKNLLHTLVFIVDSSFLGHFSSLALAGVGVAGPFFWGVTMILISLSAGVVATVSRYWGEKNFSKASDSVATATLMMLILSLALTLIIWFYSPHIISFFTRDSQVFENALEYLHFLLLSLPFWAVSTIWISGLEASGNTFIPMIITAIANGINIIGDYFFIFGYPKFIPSFGVKGAAIATSLAYLVQFLLALYFILKYRLISKNFSLTLAHKITVISLPSFLENLIMQIGFQVFNKIVAMLGPLGIAGHRVALSLESLAFMPAVGLATAGATLTGQNLGKKKFKTAEILAERTVKWGIWLMVAFAAIFFFFSKGLVKIFTPDTKLIEKAAVAIKIGAFEQPFLAMSIIYASCLRGAGDTRSPMLVSLINSTFLRIGLVYLLAIYWQLGLSGVWLATTIDWLVRGWLLMVIFKMGKWKKIKI